MRIRLITFCKIPFAILLVILTLQCKKESKLDEDGLPRMSEKGLGVFAFKLNEINRVSKEGLYDEIGVGFKKDTFAISSSFKGDPNGALEIFEIQLLGVNIEPDRTYSLSDTTKRFILYITTNSCFNGEGGYGVKRQKSKSGEVRFTKVDLENKILSGTFSAVIPSDKCGDLVVSKGRFDVKYR